MAKIFTAVYLDNLKHEKKSDFFLPNERAVRTAIVMNDWVPLRIREKKVFWYQREWINRDYKIRFLRAVSFHCEAGLSPGKALFLVIEGETHSEKRLELEPALEVLNRGGAFSDALLQLKMFDKAIIAMLKAGEKTGTIKHSIEAAVSYLEARKSIWKTLASALGILSFDIFSAVSMVIGMQFTFLPWLEKNGLATDNPEAVEKFSSSLKIAYTVNGFLLGIAVLAVLGGALAVLFIFIKKGAIKDIFENTMSKLPLLRSVMFDGSLSDTFYITGKTMKGNVPFSVAIETAAEATSLPMIVRLWTDAKERILKGIPIHRALDSKLLTKAEKLELEAHQNNKQLSELFISMADERGYTYRKGMRKLVIFVTIATVVYTAIVVLVGLKVLWVQNEGFMESLKSFGGGF